MKYSLIKNDKSTSKDELLFAILTVAIAAVGVILYVCSDYFAGFSSIIKNLAVILVILSVMYVPCIIYRLFTNDKK